MALKDNKCVACLISWILWFKKGIMAVLKPSLVAYFFWSCIMYLGCGGFVFMGRTAIRKELCKVIPQGPADLLVKNIGQGCANCSGKLLMCPKTSLCWRAAVNLTYLKYANNSEKKLYVAFRRMAVDPNCADLVEDASTPMDMLAAIKKRAAGSTPEELRPSAECLKFHCSVMINTIMEKDLTSSNLTCPNKYKTKFPSMVFPPKESLKETCLCKKELPAALNFATANKMIGICSEWSTGKKQAMLSFVIDSIILSKDSCFRPNMAAWKAANAGAVKKILNSAVGNNCLSLFSIAKGAAQTITMWYGKTHEIRANAGQLFAIYDANRYKIPAACGPMMCNIFKSALMDTTRCFWNNNTNLNMTSSEDIQKIVTMCGKALITIDADVVTKELCTRRQVEGPFKKLTCPPEFQVWTTTTTAGATTAAATTVRRLEELTEPPDFAAFNHRQLNYEDPRSSIYSGELKNLSMNYSDVYSRNLAEAWHGPQDLPYAKEVPYDEVYSRNLAEAWHGPQDIPYAPEVPYDSFEGVKYSSGFSGEESSNLLPAPEGSDGSWDPFGEMEGEQERELQDTTTAAGGGGGSSSGGSSAPELPPYKVDAWSKCICLQQCVPGVQVRDVTCEAKACMEPEPPSKQACICLHCADCIVDMNLMIISFTYVAQGAIAGTVCAAFAHFSSKDEDDLASLNICEKLLGCFCKCLPLYVRVLTILSFFQLIFLCLQCFVPTTMLAMSIDCNQVIPLKDTAMITSLVWLLQLLFGVTAKNTVSVPAWLFAPMRPGKGIIYKLKVFLRKLGP